MKITGVTPWLVKSPAPYLDTAGDRPDREREYVFVQVSTDEGITGWGEITGTSPVANRAVCAMLAQTSSLIEGDDATRIETIWNKVFRAFTYMGTRGATSNIVSAIDIALWDIRGKQLGLPIYELGWRGTRSGLDISLHTSGGWGRSREHCSALQSDCRNRSYRVENRSVPSPSGRSQRLFEWADGCRRRGTGAQM